MKLLCESVCFSYSGKQWIFEDYNRVFTSGITILKGYSGCGKTTLLKILAGYLSPQRGRVITPRRKVQADSLYRRKEVSYMFQGLNLLPLATVERNLQLCAEMPMLPKKQWTRRADDSDVLLLDEPTSGLDDGNTEIIKNLIKEYPADKICILSTHDSRLFDLTHEIIDFNLSVSL